MRRSVCIDFAILVFAAWTGTAQARPLAPPLPGHDGPVLLGPYVEVLEDREGRLRLEDVLSPRYAPGFVRSESHMPNFGFTSSAFWFRFRFPDGVQPGEALLLEVRWAPLDRLELFAPVHEAGRPLAYRTAVGGDQVPWHERDIKHRNHVFRLAVPPQPDEHDVYLRVASEGSVSVPAYLWRSETFGLQDRDSQLVFGLFYGLVLALILYNLMLYVAIQDLAYLYYVLYATSYATFIFALDGFAFEYLWPQSTWAANAGTGILLASALVFGTQFSRTFLDTRRIVRWADRILQLIAAASAVVLLCAATGWLLSYRQIATAGSGLALSLATVAIVVGIRALLGGHRVARFFLLAWTGVLVSIMVFALRNFAFVPHHFLTVHGLHLGLALDVVLLSFALGDRINVMKREREAAQSEARAQEIANRHKTEFLANMSHELRTPLNAIIGFSEVLSEKIFGELNEKQADYMKDIHGSGRHLLSLINDILDLSKVEAGRMELEVTEFDLPAALDNALTLVRERALRVGIALTNDVDPALGPIRADERKVKQILLNLLSNAVKFTPQGGRVSVAARLSGGEVSISVADSGIGIAPEDQVAVFEEFRQVGGDQARNAEGTGLGLALAKRFVELHGGTIRLESAIGKGSVFTFTLPLRQGQ
jgi:signal transduction histidine kinase